MTQIRFTALASAIVLGATLACSDPVSVSAKPLIGSWQAAPNVIGSYRTELTLTFAADGKFVAARSEYQDDAPGAATRPSFLSVGSGSYSFDGAALQLNARETVIWLGGATPYLGISQHRGGAPFLAVYGDIHVTLAGDRLTLNYHAVGANDAPIPTRFELVRVP